MKAREPAAASTSGSLSPEDQALLLGIARWLGERRLGVPALLFLESVKPLNFVGSQLLYFFQPLVQAFVGGLGYERFAALMEDRKNVEVFLSLVEREATPGRSGGEAPR